MLHPYGENVFNFRIQMSSTRRRIDLLLLLPRFCKNRVLEVELNLLFNVTINDISVIYVTAHRCAGGLKKKLDLRSGSHAIDIL